ncbi:MAG: NAD(P)H-hydrate dehydratase [Marinobacter sp.]|uniref:NAD(P)H-hydrate dehydratase n=1 Tax=Marinobacter sp. TaxID=50741 RepID=UPI00299CFEB7|nr:NAD(P)H-hydrate dehydratase [Marinobacter sp.]MDX1635512.1 NAD(P)H-hydrate dehydratase [Marinobacter sp.]
MSATRATSLTNSQNTLLYSAESVRAIDQYVIENQGVEGFELMQRAAAAAFRQLVREWPQASPLLVLCGGGNNGGDGYLVAAAARRHGLRVRCVAVKDPAKLKGDAASAYQKAKSDGVSIDHWDQLDDGDRKALFGSAGLIVDAMLGTGVKGAPREPVATIIEACNEASAPVLAVDIPSGLDATTGVTEGAAIHAAVTVTFIALKSGLFLGQGPECAGRVDFEALDLAVEASVHGQTPNALRFDWSGLRRQLPRRPVTAHKGRFGHLLVVAGDHGFGGAGLMAAEAAARCGAGLVTLATRPEHVTAALTRCPSLMVRGIGHGSELAELIEAADILVCGPGLGQHAWGQQMLQQVLKSGRPRVLDADALNLMAKQEPVEFDQQVLTPHPGEAARLLQCSVKDIEADRLDAATSLQRKYGGVTLLKGAGTVVADGQSGPWVLDGGNPGMATGGMGDILSGMIGALMGQGLAPMDAARMAAGLHLAAANLASRHWGYMGLLPMDVLAVVPRLLAVAEGLVDGGEL